MTIAARLPREHPTISRLTLRRLTVWGVTALAMIVMPLIFNKGFALSMLSQMGIAIIFALSYNMLLGQTGLLSFGHAVYYGLGAFICAHTLNAIGAGKFNLPVTLLPVVGGLAGLFFGIIFGYVTTRRSGTPFAMISLGIAEMVAACALMFPGFFGGEGGIATNRQVGQVWHGISYGPQIQVYYLIAGWCFICMIAMFALTQTPLGRMANAVRDNPERARFVGYNPTRVRYLVLCLSSFFAGIAGGLGTINYEIVTAENVGVAQSGSVLIMAFVGGVGHFFGPILGAILVSFLQSALSSYTQAWLLYFGLFFVFMILFAPGGIASLLTVHLPAIRAGLFARLVPGYLLAAVGLAVPLVSGIALVEMIYHLEGESETGNAFKLLWISVDPSRTTVWIVAGIAFVVGVGLFLLAVRPLKAAWQSVNGELQARGDA